MIDLYNVEDISIRFKNVDGTLLRPFAESIERYRIEMLKIYENDDRLLELYNLCRRLFWRMLSSFSSYKKLISEEILQQIFKQCYTLEKSHSSFYKRYVLPILKEIKVLLENDSNELKSLVCEHINSVARILKVKKYSK